MRHQSLHGHDRLRVRVVLNQDCCPRVNILLLDERGRGKKEEEEKGVVCPYKNIFGRFLTGKRHVFCARNGNLLANSLDYFKEFFEKQHERDENYLVCVMLCVASRRMNMG